MKTKAKRIQNTVKSELTTTSEWSDHLPKAANILESPFQSSEHNAISEQRPTNLTVRLKFIIH